MSPAQRTPNQKQITRKPKRAAASTEHGTRSPLHEFPWLKRKLVRERENQLADKEIENQDETFRGHSD
jgi:hypothetical protein